MNENWYMADLVTKVSAPLCKGVQAILIYKKYFDDFDLIILSQNKYTQNKNPHKKSFKWALVDIQIGKDSCTMKVLQMGNSMQIVDG